MMARLRAHADAAKDDGAPLSIVESRSMGCAMGQGIGYTPPEEEVHEQIRWEAGRAPGRSFVGTTVPYKVATYGKSCLYSIEYILVRKSLGNY